MKKNKVFTVIIFLISFVLFLTSCKKEDSSELKLYTFSYESDNTCYVTGLKSDEEKLNLTIPSSIYKNNVKYTIIGINELAFAGCTNIDTVIIPETVTIIESQAFARCSNLKKVYLPSSLTTIDRYAFDACSSLINITLPESLTSIGYGAFRNCIKLKGINIPSNITEIKDEMFSGDYNLNYIRANVLTHISTSAFKACTGLKQVYLNQALTSSTIDENNTYLTDANINVSLNYENSDTLNNYYFVFDFSNNTCAFAGLKSFFGKKKITIPESVDFYGTNYKVNKIYDYALYNETLDSLELPDNITTLNSYCFAYSNIEKINLNKVIEVETYTFSNCVSLKSVSFSESTTSIGDYAFNYCTSLKKIELPLNLTKLNTGLFNQCTNLLSVTIYDSVKNIKSNVFTNCTNLTTINYTSTKENFDIISVDSTTSEEIKNVSIIYEYPVQTNED